MGKAKQRAESYSAGGAGLPFGLLPNSAKPGKTLILDEFFTNRSSDNKVLLSSVRNVWNPLVAAFWIDVFSGNIPNGIEDKQEELKTTIEPRRDAAQLRHIRKLVQISSLEATLSGKYILPDLSIRYISKKRMVDAITSRKVYRTGFSYSPREERPELTFTKETVKSFFNHHSTIIGSTRVLVVSGDCLKSTISIQCGFQVHNSKDAGKISLIGKDVCMLVAASPFLIGGGWRNGSSGQEENICRRTSLVHCLEDPYEMKPKVQSNTKKEFSTEEIHKRSTRKGNGRKKTKNHQERSFQESQDTNSDWTMDEFGGIYCKNVATFRGAENEGYPFLEKCYFVSLVSVAGMVSVLLSIHNNQYDLAFKEPTVVSLGDETILSQKLAGKTLRKIQVIFNIALENNHRSIVLPAWGCGVYNNPAGHMAKLFREVLSSPEYINRFDIVCFSILPNGESARNLAKFSEVFQCSPPSVSEFCLLNDSNTIE